LVLEKGRRARTALETACRRIAPDTDKGVAADAGELMTLAEVAVAPKPRARVRDRARLLVD
jgi:hypothetical protein